ncbi:MAG: NINE protein [Myxococcota bacterium]
MKDKNTAAILALFLGVLGVHKFYLDRAGTGILYLFLAVISFATIPAVLGLIDFIVLALMDGDDFNRRYNGSNMLPPVVVNMLPPAYGAPPPYGYPPQQPGYPPQAPGYPQAQPGVSPHAYPPAHGPGPAPAAAAGAPAPGTNLSPDDLARKLEKLNELRISGLLSEDEFNQQKAKLLGRG